MDFSDLTGGGEVRVTRLERDLTGLLNAHSVENGSDTPDFLLAEYLLRCLHNWNISIGARERWYGRAVPGFGEGEQVASE